MSCLALVFFPLPRLAGRVMTKEDRWALLNKVLSWTKKMVSDTRSWVILCTSFVSFSVSRDYIFMVVLVQFHKLGRLCHYPNADEFHFDSAISRMMRSTSFTKYSLNRNVCRSLMSDTTKCSSWIFFALFLVLLIVSLSQSRYCESITILLL